MSNSFRLLPEWSPQEAILLSWPDEQTDWVDWLPEVQHTYLDLIEKINTAHCCVILLVRAAHIGDVKARLKKNARVLLIAADYNDTWIRDYGFLTVGSGQQRQPVSFQFNGWGQKFAAHHDNMINEQILAPLCQRPITAVNLVLEGGAIEIDNNGTLLSTAFCLSNPMRNGNLSLSSYQQLFRQHLGAYKSIILNNGHLEGDDTDGHIDTLVRFTPSGDLVIQTAYNRPEDSHFIGLNALLTECQTHFPDKAFYQLPLPYITDSEGQRLPASYANYLISNQHIFAPIYQQPEDQIALEILTAAYAEFNIVPVNCRTLIAQYGSLHCISMQVPANTLKPEIIEQLQSGVTVYE